ncbi:serine hydrolase domain-containing protein [Sediminibacillus massiliensis]|uniref:serine hydrolase domain-containing protein n=1 Tax=Sediminibacillus massiliensis TaxID=1926277 RepID=UPI000988518A|nr:serine hydrolase [Sediminibacillus massiliensis]
MEQKSIKLSRFIQQEMENQGYNGAAYIKKGAEVVKAASGYAHRTDKRLNNIDTRFGIASGCKLFTAVAIAQLVEKGSLSFHTRLIDCLDHDFPTFDNRITIHQLLTHCSGVPDYFDEETMKDFEELWIQTPMYLLREPKDFLPLFENDEMVFRPGAEFRYNNAGYILLGLIIEQQTGMAFADYVKKYIFQKCGMNDSGYYALDALPANTALGYIAGDNGTWRTNTYSIPVKGGADGGAFVTVSDMITFWETLLGYRLLSKKHTDILLHPHISVKGNVGYGYGIWVDQKDQEVVKYHVMGYDPGVSFHSAVYPEQNLLMAFASNTGSGTFQLMKAVEAFIIENLRAETDSNLN